MIRNNTEIEKYSHNNRDYYVKREDLACLSPGPPFAKIRGLYKVLVRLKKDGYDTVGYMETAISMAGWGITYLCKHLNMKAVIFYPKYKDGYKYNQERFVEKWKNFGGEVIPLEKPNLLQINAIRAKKIFEKKYKNGMWMKPGLKFNETIYEVEKESKLTIEKLKPKTVVCAIGSGVMITGVLRGIAKSNVVVNKVYGVMVHTGTDPVKMMDYVFKLGEFKKDGLFGLNLNKSVKSFEIVSGGYLYHEIPEIALPPFPCNLYYEMKAYKYLIDHISELEKPILFWNIGA